MGHWFDDLARPQTRRTAVKAAAVVGAALLWPAGRPSRAVGSDQEACYVPCLKDAELQQQVDDEACAKRYGVEKWAEYAPIIGSTITTVRHERWALCNAVAAVHWHERIIGCRFKPDCGDPAKFPGGNPPATLPGGCDPGSVLCGDYCCNLAYATCVGCNGSPICCRINGNCCGSA